MEKNSQIKTRQMPFMKQIAKFSSCQYFPLYDIMYLGVMSIPHRVLWEGLVNVPNYMYHKTSCTLSVVVSSMVVGTGFCPIIIITHVTHSHMT